MLKIRLMGTKNDIKWMQKQLLRNPNMNVSEISECYQNKGTKKYYRCYLEVKKEYRRR